MPTPPSNNQPTSPAFQVKPWTPPDQADKVAIYEELGRAADGPGEMFNMMSGKHLEDVRDQYEQGEPARGVRYVMKHTADGQRASVQGFEDIPAPTDPHGDSGTWDPTRFAPRYVFDKREDAFPVRPDYDGNADTGDNAAGSLKGTTGDHYRDGVVDAQQALSGAFVVSQKGEYTVLTYSNYYATNKGADYHKNDYSTAQVYLKPDKFGELKPVYLATSWHYGTQLTPWEDVKKDAQGHPVIQVGLGTHSLQPLGKDQAIPRDGLQIGGDGQATFDGKAIGQQMTYDAFQSNVSNATLLSDADSDRAKARRKTLGYGMVAVDPLLPSTFTKDDTVKQVERRLGSDFSKVEHHEGGDKKAGKATIADAARKVGVKDPESYHGNFLDKLRGFFGF